MFVYIIIRLFVYFFVCTNCVLDIPDIWWLSCRWEWWLGRISNQHPEQRLEDSKAQDQDFLQIWREKLRKKKIKGKKWSDIRYCYLQYDLFFSNETKEDDITLKPKKVHSNSEFWKSMFWHLFVPNFSLGCQLVWLQSTFEVNLSISHPLPQA